MFLFLNRIKQYLFNIHIEGHILGINVSKIPHGVAISGIDCSSKVWQDMHTNESSIRGHDHHSEPSIALFLVLLCTEMLQIHHFSADDHPAA